ncbi:hypothetical protein LCGC14_2327980, partial [marine sediment metagenome]
MSLERDLQKALQRNRAALPPTLRLASTAKLAADMRAMERMRDSTKTVANALAQTQDSGRMVADVLARIQDSGKMVADVMAQIQDSGKMAADVMAQIQDSGKMAADVMAQIPDTGKMIADVLARIPDPGKMVADVLAMTRTADMAMAKLSGSLLQMGRLSTAFSSIAAGLEAYSPEVTFSDGCLTVDG